MFTTSIFNLYAEQIMQSARLDEAQAGIKISGRNINNLRYTHDTILMAESKEEKQEWVLIPLMFTTSIFNLYA